MRISFRGMAVFLVVLGFSIGALAAGRWEASARGATFTETAEQITLSNDYLDLALDRATHRVLKLAADHAGKRNFGRNLLGEDGIRFGSGEKGSTQVEVLEHGPQRVRLRLSWTGRESARQESTTLTITVDAGIRGVQVEAVFGTSAGGALPGVRMALRQWFLAGLFDRGVVQYVAGQDQAFVSRERLRLFYTMDHENGSVAIEPLENSDLAETVLVSGRSGLASGIELRPELTQEAADGWKPLSPKTGSAVSTRSAATSGAGKAKRITFEIYANDLPFPAHRAENGITGDERAARDSAAYFDAVYGSAVGVLGSYAEPGSAYPTLASPDRPYGDAFDFFDPDAWSTVTALSYSGDPWLEREARQILERSASAQLADGQIPHHFEGGAATYLSIAKSKQTGPNIFWTIAASEYAAGTGDEAWLRAHYAHLRLATEWVLARYDPAHRLLRAEGPLFIDVFRRSGYTLDTNVAALYLLSRMAEVAEFCGDAESAERYRRRRQEIERGLRDELWNHEDHFITQKNLDGSSRDLVDYDGNFAALAFGVLDAEDAGKLLDRLDAGAHTHPAMRGTWVSERRYEPDDCYGGNDGDSDVTMARIWWLDMAARVRLGDRNTFDKLLNVLETDLLRDVWMPERYDAEGLPAHNGYYHEYPDIVTVVLREMRYGVHVGMEDVSVHPLGSANFDLRLGDLRVAYSPDAVSIEVPGSSVRRFTVGGLRASARYTVSTGESVVSDGGGTLYFRGPSGRLIQIQRSR